jgi:hypothetical protein
VTRFSIAISIRILHKACGRSGECMMSSKTGRAAFPTASSDGEPIP